MRRAPFFHPRAFLSAALIATGLAGLTLGQNEKNPAPAFSGKAVIVPVTSDDLDDSHRFRDLLDLLGEAQRQGAPAAVLEINVRGGSSLESCQRLLEELPRLELKTFAFVNASALGAGALMALGTDAIYMAPASIVGGSGVEVESEENDEVQKRKLAQELSVLKARARSLAAAKGHDPLVAEAFIDSEIEVKKGDILLSPKGELLTLTAGEAVRAFDGRPVLAKAIVESAEALLKAESIAAEPLRISPRDFAAGRNRERLSSAATPKSEAKDAPAGEGDDKTLFGKRDQKSYAGKVIRITIGEEDLVTGKARFEFMDRTLKKAQIDGASAVIFDMDTPGGFAWYSKGLLLNSLQGVTVPTYAFVNTRAESAGAIIAIGTDAIYMRPAATIGSALVVGGGGTDLAESMEDKVTQMAIAAVRNMAELKGHNPDVAEAFVTQDKEVKIDGVVVHPAGHVLNLNTIDATRQVGGRPVLAKGVANSVDDLVTQEKLSGEVIDATAYGMESVAHWIQKFSFLLIMLGIAGAYMEMQAPGFGVPGIVSLLAFGLFFFGNYMAGNLAGYELAVLLAVGLILIGVEIFLLPGTVIPGVAGGIMVLVAIGMAMVDRVDFTYAWKGFSGAGKWGEILGDAAQTLALSFVGAVAMILVAMRYLPKTKFGGWMVLHQAVPGGASIALESDAGEMRTSYLGLEGEAATDLRPAGKGRFGGLWLDIISDGEYIEKGTPLKVVRHEGVRIVVARRQV
jgi:membrane-bound serine protease (ClpP class)